MNYVVPTGTALGSATVTVTSADGTVSTGRLEIQPVAPGVFRVYGSEIDWDGGSETLPAAQVVRLRDGMQTVEPVFRLNAAGQIVPVRIDLGRDTDEVSLVLFGTGWRFRSSLANVFIVIGGTVLPVQYAGPQGEFSGLDQINVRISSLRFFGGEASVWIAVDGRFESAGYLPLGR